jgi:uncharacterized protein (DUF1015 family)
MATLKPFAALRPKPELAAQICELPYDVMSSEEARQMAAGNPLSFLHVSKPEIDLPPGTDLYSDAVYAKGKENFTKLISQGALKQDAQPCFYLYRQIMGGTRRSVSSPPRVARNTSEHHQEARVHPPGQGRRPRPPHRNAQLPDRPGVPDLSRRRGTGRIHRQEDHRAPDVDFTGKDGVRHTSWTVGDAAGIQFIAEQFAKIPFLYIADGHHRSAAAGRVYQSRGTRKGAGHSGQFLTVIFPHNQMQILPYNRVLKDLNGLTAAQLLQKLDGIFVIKPNGAAKPTRKHELGLFIAGQWHTLTFRPQFAATNDPIEKLDVTLLQKFVLDPIFGITDPRTSKQINFVGGIRGTAELEKLVTSGEYACAFSMFPTSIEDLMTIADAGGIMPPKSTWFEPKLRDAMFCHMI